MKYGGLISGRRVRSNGTPTVGRSVCQSDRKFLSERISSLRPHLAVLAVAVGAWIAFGAGVWRLLSSGEIPWALFGLGTAHALVALAGFVTWKHVRCGDDHYIVSDLFKSETISFSDVCMVVEARGFLWNTVRIHLCRPSRFGWGISFVPTCWAGMSGSLVAAWRTRRSTRPSERNRTDRVDSLSP
jgi:hypothetical protein